MILRAGTYIQNRYEIIERIGSGGMSDVYRAKDHKLGRLVGIKVLKDEYCNNLDFVEKFKMEAQAAAGLENPNIVNVYDVVDEGSLHYIVMELVNGVTLKNYISRMGHLGIKESISIAIQAANGINAAHNKGIIHRDIKPQNMMISAEGKVKVADFGIARASGSDPMSTVAMGSVEYISPEQAQGIEADERSDIYSLGISLFEMVTGKLPFEGETTVATALMHIENELPLPSRYNPLISKSLEQIILKATQKKPERRYQNCNDMIADLRKAFNATDVIVNVDAFTEDPNATRMISQEELGQINTSAKLKKSASGRSEEDKYRDVENDRVNARKEQKKKQDTLITVISIIVALLIIVLVVFVLGKTTGFLDSSNTQIEIESSENDSISDTEVEVPDVKGLSEELAVQKMHDYSLEVKYEYANDDTVQNGYVLSQNPEAGNIAPKYSTVTVTISLGTDGEDLSKLGLIGLSEAEVVQQLNDKGYTVSVQSENNDTYASGLVCRLDPVNPDPGGNVLVVVSLGIATEVLPVPDIKGLTEDLAIAALVENNMTAGSATEEYSNTIPKGCIISQTPEAESEAPAGTAVSYVVSAGYSGTFVTDVHEQVNVQSLIGPGMSGVDIQVYIRLHQNVEGNSVYTDVTGPLSVGEDNILYLDYDHIVGADEVYTGEIEVVKLDNNDVFQSIPVQFYKLDPSAEVISPAEIPE